MMIVQKYGGSSLAQPEQIKAVAMRARELHEQGHQLILVVSAMGSTTDQLLKMAYEVSGKPNRRELDMLLSTGERISMALLSMALNDAGCPSISFTGSQAGLLTDESHSNARVIDVKPVRLENELNKNNIIVLAGFQGVSPKTKEITTLGRGGSDTTAVVMALYFKAERCEILKDVAGVYSADPRLVSHAKPLPHLSYQQLLEMTFAGAKVLHYRSVELAALFKIPLLIGLSQGQGNQTLINDEAPMYEQNQILSVNSHKYVRAIQLDGMNIGEALKNLEALLSQAQLPWPQILDSEKQGDGWSFLITAPLEILQALLQSLQLSHSQEWSTVTATCQGAFASALPEKISTALANQNIRIEKILFSSLSLTVLVSATDHDRTVQTLHELKVR
jgi:aspartate kinase